VPDEVKLLCKKNASNSDVEQELLNLVQQEQQRVRSSFPFEGRLGVMELARAMDKFWIWRHLNPIEDADDKRQVEQLTTFGLNKALSLFLDESCDRPDFPLARSTESWQQWADSVLQQCGQLGLCEHVIELHRTGLGTLAKVESGYFLFQYGAGPVGIEAHDRESFAWLRSFVAKHQEPSLEQLEAVKEQVWSMMSELVSPWEAHFIQYDTSPTIDSYYETFGMLYAQLMTGQDSFPGGTKFGDYEFDLYRATIGVLVGWAFKHMRFCLELLKKRPGLDPRNLFTIPQRVEVKATYLAAALDVDEKFARHAISVLSLSRTNIGVHCIAPGEWVAPPFIEVGLGRILTPVWGSQSHPFRFLLRELKRRYRSDWDRGVGAREQVFRQELYMLLPQPQVIKFHHNIRLRVNGAVLTDVDATVFDRRTGTVGLFQLKGVGGK